MKKKLLAFLLMLTVVASLGMAQGKWRLNPYTGKLDYYESKAGLAPLASPVFTGNITVGEGLGADVVVNGSFTGNADGWTLGSFTYGSNAVSHANGGGTTALSQAITLTAATWYKFQVTISGYSAGYCVVLVGGQSELSILIVGNGTKTFYFYNEAGADLSFTPSDTFVATLDTVTLRPLSSGDITVGRKLTTLDLEVQSKRMLLGDDDGNMVIGDSTAGIKLGGTYPVSNIIIGAKSAPVLINGGNNVIIGTSAALKLTNSYNTLVGGNVATYVKEGNRNVAVGYTAMHRNEIGSYGVYIGYDSGSYETGSNKLYIDSIPRASEADGRLKALIYGVFAAATADQQLSFNADVKIPASQYLNWGTTFGTTGYGLRDNSGSIEVKDSAGTWLDLSTIGGAPTDAHYFTDQAESGLSAEVVVTANGKSLITAANYAAMRTLLDVEVGVDFNAYTTNLATVSVPTAWRIFYSNGTSVLTELALGADGTYLRSNGVSAAPTFGTPSGAGDFVGPASSTDNAVVRFDLATGKLGQNSVLLVGDTGIMTGGTWQGTVVAPTYGGVGANTVAMTGYPYMTAGVVSQDAVLTKYLTTGIQVNNGANYIRIFHDGTNGNIVTNIGGLIVDSGDSATPAYIELSDDDTNVVKIVSQEMAADWTMTIPAAVPSANNQPLIGATSGTLSFSAIILPASGTIYKLPVYSAANTIGELAAVGATGEYLAGATGAIPLWATLNQAAVAGLTTASGPTFDHIHTATIAELVSVGTITTGTWNALKKIIPVNSGNNATVDLTAAGTCYGQIYTNAANDSDTHYDLPAAVVGMSMTFFVTDAFTITVDPNGTERIIGTSANGDYLQGAATIGNMLALVCVKTGEWQTVGKNGTWTEE